MSTYRQAPSNSRPPTRAQLRQRAVRDDSDNEGPDPDHAVVTLSVTQTQAAIAIQDLSSATRSRITESDTSRVQTVPVYVLQNARECNRPETNAAKIARANRVSLAVWADFGRTANARADVEELRDINSGQTHRGRLNDTVEFEKQKNGGELDWDAADVYGYRREHEAKKAKEAQNKSSGKGGGASRGGGRGGGTAGRAGRGGGSPRGGGRAGGVAGTGGRNINTTATALLSSNRVTPSPVKGASNGRQTTAHLGRGSSQIHDRPADPAVDPDRSYGYSGKGRNMIPYTTGGNATGLDPALARHHNDPTPFRNHTKAAGGTKTKGKTPGNARAPQPPHKQARVPPQLPAWWSAANLATNTPAGFGTRNGVDIPSLPFSANSSSLSTTSASPVFTAPPQQTSMPNQDAVAAQAASVAQTIVHVQGPPSLSMPPVGVPARTHVVLPTQTYATHSAISRAQTSTSAGTTTRTDHLASPADFMEAVSRKQTRAQRVVPAVASQTNQVAKTTAQAKMNNEISAALTQPLSRESIREVPVSEIHFPPPHRSDARHGEASSWTDGQPSPVSFSVQSERSSIVPSPLPWQGDFLLLSADNAGSYGLGISIPTASMGSGRENVAKSPTGESIDLMNMEVNFVNQPTLTPDLPSRSNHSLQEGSQSTADMVDQVSTRTSQLSLSIPSSTTTQPRFLGVLGADGAVTKSSYSDFTNDVGTALPVSQVTDLTSISPYEHQGVCDRRSQQYQPEPLQSVDLGLNRGGQATGQVARKAPTSARRYSPAEMVEIGNNVRIATPPSSKSNQTVRQTSDSDSTETNLTQGFPNKKVRAEAMPTAASLSTNVFKKPANPFQPFQEYNAGPESNKRKANSTQYESMQDQRTPLGYTTVSSDHVVDTSRIVYPETDVVDNQTRYQEKLIQLMNSGPGAGMTPFSGTKLITGDRKEGSIQKSSVSRALATLSTNGISPRKRQPATSKWKITKDTVTRQNEREEQQPKPAQESAKDAIIGDQKLIQRSSNVRMPEIPARATISVHTTSRSGPTIPDWLTKEVTQSGNRGRMGQRNGLMLPTAVGGTSQNSQTPTFNPQLTAMPYSSQHSQASRTAKAFGITEDDDSDESEL